MTSPPHAPPEGEEEEEVLILFGSQTGNSEQAARTLASELPSQLSSAVKIKTSCMQLDDFLERRHAQWTRLVVIITSSYGVGQAPLGCYLFRRLCDEILTLTKNPSDDDKDRNAAALFQSDTSSDSTPAVYYAMMGLGDSKYTTFFRNPTVIDQAMTAAGTKRIGRLGKVDASGTGEEEMEKVMEIWRKEIVGPIGEFLATTPKPTSEALHSVQQKTLALCRAIGGEDFEFASIQEKGESNGNTLLVKFMLWIVLPLVGAILVWYLGN